MKKAANVSPIPGSLTDRAQRLAEKTSDAYSFDRYRSWAATAKFLLARGYTEIEAEAILRSKWMRWAADASDYDGATSVDLAMFLDKRGPRSMFKTHADLAHQVAELVRDTFGDVR